ncbi:MAG: ATP-grasp domain-containing protein [Planctomycetaceae bacterium]
MRHLLIVEELLSCGRMWGASADSLREEAAVMLLSLARDLVCLPQTRVSALLSSEALAGAVGDSLRLAGVELLLAADGPEQWLRSPPVSPAQFTATLAIAPESSGLLVQRLQQLQSGMWSGVTSLNVSWPQAMLFGDKAATAVWLGAHDLRTPETWLLTESAAERLAGCLAAGRLDLRTGQLWDGGECSDLPVDTALYVLKPRDGCGCGGVQLVCLSREQLAAVRLESESESESVQAGVLSERYRWLLQPLQSGRHCSAALIGRGDQGVVLLPAGEQWIECESGRFRYTGGSLPAGDELQQAVLAPLRQLAILLGGFRGWLGVDFVFVEGGELQIVEINPRLCTSYAGYRLLAETSLPGVLCGDFAVGGGELSWRSERVNFRV